MNTKILFLVIFSALAMKACTSAESSKAIPAANAPIPVKIMELKKEEVSQQIVAAGQFTTNDETSFSFKTGGVVEAIHVKEGDFVKKGQLLAVLDLTEIRAAVNQARLGLEKAGRDLQRAENLYKDSVATLEQLQNAQTMYQLAEQQWEAARFNLNFSEIRAKADGYILKKFVNQGQIVGPGQPVLMANGAGKSNWIFKAAVSDKEWAIVEVGDLAYIQTDASPETKVKAHLIRKAEGADAMNGSFTLEFEIEDAGQVQLATGLFGRASITPLKRPEAWKIPYASLLDGNGNRGFVFITNDKVLTQKVPVQILSLGKDFVYIAQGLENSRYLITSGSAYLTEGSAIVIIAE